MASMKAKKGNPAERLIAYNLMLCGYKVTRLDDNTAGIDLIAVNEEDYGTYTIEVKFHQKFSWNEINKILNKTIETTAEKFSNDYYHKPLFVFKSNRQPWLVAYMVGKGMIIITFEKLFEHQIVPIPKGYKVWKD